MDWRRLTLIVSGSLLRARSTPASRWRLDVSGDRFGVTRLRISLLPCGAEYAGSTLPVSSDPQVRCMTQRSRTAWARWRMRLRGPASLKLGKVTADCGAFQPGAEDRAKPRILCRAHSAAAAAPCFSNAGQLTITSSGSDPPAGVSTRKRLPSGATE